MPEPERRWLKVPYSEKAQAKKIGAQWDALVKLWWVPMHVPLRYVQKWLPGKNDGRSAASQ